MLSHLGMARRRFRTLRRIRGAEPPGGFGHLVEKALIRSKGNGEEALPLAVVRGDISGGWAAPVDQGVKEREPPEGCPLVESQMYKISKMEAKDDYSSEEGKRLESAREGSKNKGQRPPGGYRKKGVCDRPLGISQTGD